MAILRIRSYGLKCIDLLKLISDVLKVEDASFIFGPHHDSGGDKAAAMCAPRRRWRGEAGGISTFKSLGITAV